MRIRVVFSALVVALLTVTLTTVAPASATGYHRDGPNTIANYTISFENLTHGQYFTPPNFAVHDRSADVFSRNRPASPGVQAVAENGGVPVLAAELAAAIDDTGKGVSGVGADAPIAPGESVTFDVASNERRLSIVSMIICTNDGFAGLDGRALPRFDGQTSTYYLRSYDAGTERNTENREDLVPAPFCGEGEGSGESNPELAENGKIKRHRGIHGVGDIDPAVFDWDDPVVKVTVTRNDVPVDVDYTVSFENLTHGQYFTPPNFAVHNSSADVFSRNRAASDGVRAVAENGGVPVLAAELMAAIDDTGKGVSGVGADAPIAPGESVTFNVSSPERRLSIVSMIICTNDGFAGLDAKNLPRRDGQTRTYYLRAYDAGTEINTEARQDLVPAPFCGEGEGTGESNPELGERNTVKPHRGIRGVGDLDPDVFGWTGPVVKVTVTRNG